MVAAVAQEDDVPETNTGTPQAAAAATPKPDTKAEILADFAEALQGYGNRVPEAGHSEEAQAGEEKAVAAAPAKAEDTKSEAKADKPAEVVKPPNFDGLPDTIRSTFEKLHKGEALEPEERAALIAEVPKGYLRQSDYTQKRMKDAEARREFEAEKAKQAEQLAALNAILSDPKKQAAFLKAMSVTDEQAPAEVDLATLDPADQRKAIKGMVKDGLTEEQKAAAAQQAADDQAEAGLKGAASEWYDTVKDTLSVDEGRALMETVQQEWARDGVNPLRDVKPAKMTQRLTELADILVAKKEAAAAKQQLTKRQADGARSAKASSTPNVRVTAQPDYDLRRPEDRLKKSLADLGIDDWSQVPFGNRGPETAV